MLFCWELYNTWKTRVVQYTPIWDVLNHSKQDIMEISTTSGLYTLDVAHSAKADQSYYARRWRAPVPLEMCYIVPLNQIASNE